MSQKSNLKEMAGEIVEKCKLLDSSRTLEVLNCLEILYQRKNSSIESIDDYIENLYEGIKEKLVATRKILDLAKVPKNMDSLISNESLMSALTRVLREDTKRSLELVTTIIFIFFCFSNFSDFHSYITKNKMGDMCLKIIDQEKSRWKLWKDDLDGAGDGETNLKKYKSRLKRQDQLLFLTFNLLLNLSEELNLEVKMVKRGIISSLMIMIDRPSSDLVLSVLTFLKKLSVFEENKNEMIKVRNLIDSRMKRLFKD
jgi:Rad3-related DNA helicase